MIEGARVLVEGGLVEDAGGALEEIDVVILNVRSSTLVHLY